MSEEERSAEKEAKEGVIKEGEGRGKEVGRRERENI